VRPTRPFPARYLLLSAIACLAGGTAVARPAAEEPDNLLNDRFTLQGGLVLSSNSTDLRQDSSAGTLGTSVNAERDLGLPAKKLTGFAEMMFRMKTRHRIRLSNYYLPLDRHGTTVLTNTINFGNTTYNVNDTVTSSLKVRSFALTYTYSFIKSARIEVGASLGFNVIGFDGQVSVPARLRTEYASNSAPAPLGGLEAAFRLSNRFYVEARGQYVKGTISGVNASLTTMNGSLLFRLNPNVTFGAGYLGYSANVGVSSVGDSGHYELSSKGPHIFARVGF
jgi:hypothetical protein